MKIQCPAKINLNLKVVNKREDGFHNIESVMQTISLYDYLTIDTENSAQTSIVLSGNSNEIPYDKTNLVYKAAELFLNETQISGKKIKIYIEKNIPISAGLGGGSADAAGTIYGLNEIFDNPLNEEQLHKLCAKLGSDLNVCLKGGCLLATSRGEQVEQLPYLPLPVTLIKPRNLGISAKEAYTKYAGKTEKPKYNMTEKMIEALKQKQDIREFLYNDLEYAVFDDYKELQYIKLKLPDSIMSGSGSTYFILDNSENINFPEDYQVIKKLHFIPDGCSVAD